MAKKKKKTGHSPIRALLQITGSLTIPFTLPDSVHPDVLSWCVATTQFDMFYRSHLLLTLLSSANISALFLLLPLIFAFHRTLFSLCLEVQLFGTF